MERTDLLPAFYDNNVSVVFSSSDEYAGILSVAISSILENSSNVNNYDIIVLSNGIHGIRKKVLTKQCEYKDNFSIRFIEMGDILSNFNFYTRDHVTESTYLRLFVIDLLKNFDKTLYLDCDLIVTRDIADLYSINIDDYWIAAVRDTIQAGWNNQDGNPQIQYNKEELSLSNVFDYFQAGVLLFNLARLREQYTSEELLKIASEKEWRWFDQDVLNKVCNGHVLFLDNRWNVMCRYYSKIEDLAEYFAPEEIFSEYKKAVATPWIVHFAGGFSPCFSPFSENAELFWQYAKNCPFYESLLLLKSEKIEKNLKSRKFLLKCIFGNTLTYRVVRKIYHFCKG